MMRRPLLRGLAGLAIVVAVAATLAAAWAYADLRGSLARLEGRLMTPGLDASVEVQRDALGIPAIRGQSRRDVAFATGFVHAQDRFFQMDLARRQSAGELAGLAGAAAVPLDADMRRHRFRDVARRAVARLDPSDRAILDAYAAGVNAGLEDLRSPPFEYRLLRQSPRPWRPEDSLLVVQSMFVTLQAGDGAYEATLATMHDVLPGGMLDFLAPLATRWDAPLDGEALPPPPLPGSDVYDLRSRRAALRTTHTRPVPARPAVAPDHWVAALRPGVAVDAPVGSNSWAVAGARTPDGAALLANDMHLTVRVPNTWYRVLLEWPDADVPGDWHRLAGVTLPGLPVLVAGSNTRVAWGFTNAYADWSDIVLLELDPDDAGRYRTPDGWRAFDRHRELIEVAGDDSHEVEVVWTIWGPMLPPDHRGRPRALRWVAHDADRLSARLTPLELAGTIEEAFETAHGVGAPGQNLVVADRDGRIGWTIYGSVPRRVGLDGRVPISWADGTRGWDGWLDPADYPRIVDPEDGLLWTANARVVGGAWLARIGDGGYDPGARGWIVRDRLRRLSRATPGELLAIQLDTGADFLAPWRDLLLGTLASGPAGDQGRTELARIVRQDWSGEARPDSAAYRLTRMFREAVIDRALAFVLVECLEADPAFDPRRLRNRGEAAWRLVTERPLHLLDPAWESWEAFLLATADAVVDEARAAGPGDLSERVWSEWNVTAYRHPLSAQVPALARWLDMPPASLPGDAYTVRVHWRSIAASMRMVVSPGREEEGLLHMPTGQSGHPRSPFYGNSHPAWVEGAPQPLLPGAPVYRLVLAPGRAEP